MKSISKVILVLVILLASSCSDAGQAKIGGYGSEFKIELYSGGKLLRTYVSTGKVKSEDTSDGYYFVDKATGRLIEITGDIIITKL